MAASGDFAYLGQLISEQAIAGNVLELGSYNRQRIEQGNARVLCERHGLKWEGTDIEAGPDVDFALDLLDTEAVAAESRRWDTLLVMNLLEHVYDPIRLLENALGLLRPNGALVVVGPVVWELHDFPADYWRPMPDFFIEFARRHSMEIGEMQWILGDRLVPVSALRDGPQKLVPSKGLDALLFGRRKALWSRVVHRAARTTGRHTFFPYSGLGVRLRQLATTT